jgi:NAD(P)H-dependent FMN reductase
MSDALHVLVLPGALRERSLNRALARAAVREAPADLRLTLHELHGIPLYDGDVEAAGMPAPVAALRAAIAGADALLFCTPESNSSIPGVLKNAIDWASRGKDAPLGGKPAAIAGASPGGFGTIRAQTHLRQVLQFCGVEVMPKPELYLSRAAGLFGDDGELADAEALERLQAHLAAFGHWARARRG